MLGKDLHEGRPTTSMKKGWLCRTSYDEKNHETAPVLIQIERWSRSSDDVLCWSRSSDDPDLVMMIQQWWSRSSDDPDTVQWCRSRSRDDPDPVMMFYVDPDREMIQIQWRCPMMIEIERWSRFKEWRWLEDEYDLKTQKTWDADDEMIQLIQRRRPMLKIVSKEYLPS